MKKIVLVLLAMGMLSGCAKTVWVHPEYTPAKWKKDSYECDRDSRQSVNSGGGFGIIGGISSGIAAGIQMKDLFNRCLESKGWTKQQAAPKTGPTESISPSPMVKFDKSGSSKTLFKTEMGDFGVWYDESKWRKLEKTDVGEKAKKVRFKLIGKDGYAHVITERSFVPEGFLKEAALKNARKGGEDIKAIFEEKRLVKDREILCLKIEGNVKQIPFILYAYYYTGKEGTIQVITLTRENLFEEYEQDFSNFLNGLVISP